MDLKKNLKCCASSPICHFLALTFGTLSVIQLVHTHAHYTMDMDVDSYVLSFCKKNPDKCEQILDRFE